MLQLPAGPEVEIVFVDSDRPNKAIVGFTVDPPATADVKFWVQGVSPAAVGHASLMTASTSRVGPRPPRPARHARGHDLPLPGGGGDGLITGTSPIGTFTTGSGVEAFDVALAEAASPVFKLGTGLSPYIHVP